jgi:hypothetical protein
MIAAIAFLARWHRPLIGVAIVLALMFALNRYVADAVHDDRLKTAVEAQKADARADDIAGQVAASEQSKTQDENDEARKAANAGTDPLGDGLRKLRRK